MTERPNNQNEVPEVPEVPAAPQPPAAPPQPQYQAPQQPQQPQQPPVAPQSQYQAPQQGGYAAAPQEAGQDNNLMLNYWLSVFFTWLPALIFWVIDKDKGNEKLNLFHRENLNFSILRTAVGLVWVVPYIGWFVGFIGGAVLFVFHIMAAMKAKAAYEQNEKPPFIFNIPLIK